ncbi:MAG: transcriptional regulator of aroF, aroG, tyrA and aromatic amino acid transport [Clostridiales bacterium]|jgi:transcriptional regulator of aroF, aroG, tyrA and aromatic amino acid transport|nr:transcriptional regulator of aroF, aroG, tyrA and aromatic amino acid transport [Clostridiales bacterium]
MTILKFKVLYKDRIGMLLDLSKVLTAQDINVINLEVVPNTMYFEVGRKDDIDQKALFKELEEIPDVKKCVEIELLPWEEINQRLHAVLDAISEGVLAINSKGEISTVNSNAEKLLSLSKEELLGQKIADVLVEDVPMLNCLKTGEIYNHQEICLKKGSKRYHYLTSGRPIRDKYNNIIGAVATIKDMTDVRQLVYSVTKPAMVTFEDIIGESEKLQNIIEMGKKVAEGSSTVLLRGESGTGKELFARSIHMASSRSDQPFVPINCAALPDSLLESELFGYTEGAFTGSQRNGKQGLFEFANGGTIFLDEIGEISPHLQAKLLRVLQEGKVRRIGGQEETAVDVRVIAATNRNLEEMVEKNEFRKDLYYRLNVIPIYLPPLRERKEDIPLLVKHFLEIKNIRFGKNVEFVTKGALEKLYNHHWPGNVRELENVIERAVNLVTGKWLTEDAIIIDSKIDIFEKSGDGEKTLAAIINKVEKQVIEQALENNGSIRKAAKALGVSHTTIMNKVKKHKTNLGNNP